MATLTTTASSSIVSGKTLSITITYTVSSSDTETSVRINSHQYTATGSYSSGIYYEVTLDFPNQANPFVCATIINGQESGSHTFSNAVRSCSKTTSTKTYTLTLKMYERNPATNVNTLKDTKTATITVPVLASYTIKYNANGHGTAPGNQTKYYGLNLTLRDAITATGYTFAGWNTNSTSSGTSYNAGSYYTANAAATLYAMWNRTVTYYANGGTGAPSSQTSSVSVPIIITSSTPSRDGYRFIGWNTSADGSGTSYTASQSYATGNPNLSLYAQWDPAISNISIGSINAIRTDDNTVQDPEESDEGTYAYIEIPYTVNGAASADVSMTMTVEAESGTTPTITLVSSTATKTAGNPLSGTFIARAGICETDTRYSFTVLINALYPADDGQHPTQLSATATKSFVLPTAYFTFDVKAGGHGVHFGGSAIDDGFWVSMPASFNGGTNVIDSSVDLTVTPSANYYGSDSAYYMKDVNGNSIGFMTPIALTSDDGTYGVQFGAHRNISDTDYYSSVWIGIKGDGTDYVSVSNPGAWRKALGADDRYVLKSGDTMTGNLYIQKSGTIGLIMKHTEIAADETVIANQVNMGTRQTVDKNNYCCFYSETQKTTGGGIYQSFIVREKISGTEYPHGFYINIANDGTRTVTFPNNTSRDAFATGLNVVKKAGDVMTGILHLKSSNISDSVPSSNTNGGAYYSFYNSADHQVGMINVCMSSDAYCTLDLRARYPNTTQTAYLRLGTKSDGTQWVGVSGAAAWRNAISAVHRGGDTMTGTLTINYDGASAMMKHSVVNAHAANNGVTSTKWWGAYAQDKNAKSVGFFCGTAQNGGLAGAGMCAYNYNTSGTQVGAGAIYIFVNKSGTVSYSVTNPSAFRTAIGCAPSSYLKGWTALGNVTGTTSLTLNLTNYTEIYVSGNYSTSYRSGMFIPKNFIGSTEYEWYLGGGASSATANRRGVFKLTLTKFTPVLISVDGQNYTNSSCVWYVYAR